MLGLAIIWDARGHFAEPHTSYELALGTLEVRQYLGERPSFNPPKRELVFPTIGPENRYSNVLFIEKEGFRQILQAARLQERFSPIFCDRLNGTPHCNGRRGHWRPSGRMMAGLPRSV